MRLLASLGLASVIACLGCPAVFADEAAQIELAFRNHSDAVTRAELVHTRAIEKARDDAIAQLIRMAARAFKANDRLAETNAWKAVIKLDRSHKKAIQYFTDLGILEKVLADIPSTGNDRPAKVVEPTKPSPPAKTDMTSPAFQRWLKEVAGLSAEKQVAAVSQKLVELNPGFDGKVTPVIASAVVTEFSFASDQVREMAPVRALTGLKSLTCAGNGAIGPLADLSPVQGLKLTYLNCSFSGISDLFPVKGMPLTAVAISKTKVSDLSPLKGMKLVSFGCWDSAVTDLSPLKGMPIAHLNCIDTKIRDLSPVKGMPLVSLSMKDTPISDLSPLVGMKITGLSINGTQVADLSPLKGLPLNVLYCENTRVTQLSALQGLPLTRIFCDLKHPGDVAILRGIKTLELINDEPAAEFLKKQTSTK
ncbi:MAG: hypothetical protein JWN70_2498 [Planctomycetaceae bacterium]|nr:hypothetical protein [Planctomycetaceae bacterium]